VVDGGERAMAVGDWRPSGVTAVRAAGRVKYQLQLLCASCKSY
jgi:hypothetical protein